MKVEKATLQHLNELVTLFELYRNFYQQPPDANAATVFLKERILKNESEIFISISKLDEVTGFVQLYPLYSSTRMKRVWLLNDLFIHPEHRGKGYSKLLIERAKELCRQTNACSVTLETSKENKIGNLLYLQEGFVLDVRHNFYSWEAGQ